jgi:glucose-6-phosphate-specific signal transduction histidine kinase
VKHNSGPPAESRDVAAPWFARQPRFAVAVAALMYVAVFLLRLQFEDPSEVITALYVIPIALLSVTFGLRGGIIGSALGLLLLVLWVLMNDVDLTLSGWITRIVPLLAMGLLLGQASDRLRTTAELRRQHEIAVLRHRQAVEINDSLIQGMAAAKWSIEVGQTEAGLDTLQETIRLGQQLVSGLIRESHMGPVEAVSPPTEAAR